MRYLKHILTMLAAVAFCAVLLVVSCGKEPIAVGGEVNVETVLLPESMDLTVGDKGSFLVEFTPKDAADGSIVSLKSSDESVLKVSFDGLTVSYEALSEGTSEVSVTVGSVTRKVTVSVAVQGGGGGDVPEDPSREQSGVKLEVTGGVRTVDGPQSAAGVTVRLLEGAEAGNYLFTWSVDGGERNTVKGLFLNGSKSVSFPLDLALGRHTVTVVVSEEKDLTDPVTIESFFWVKGPSLLKAKARFTSTYDLDMELTAGVSVIPEEKGFIELTWEPQETPVEYVLSSPSFLSVQESAVESLRGSLRFPFSVVSKGSGRLSFRLVNGDETFEVSGNVDTDSSRSMGATDFSVPRDYAIALGGGVQTYQVVPVPENAYKPVITEASSSNTDILKVSFEGLKLSFTPVYTGEAEVTVTLSGVTKKFKVTVTGNVVTDFTLPADFTLVKGEGAEHRVEATPAGALDAQMSVSCSDEGVLKVVVDGMLIGMQGLKPGEATVKVTVGKVEKSFKVTVIDDIVTDFTLPDDMTVTLGGGARSFVFVTTPAGASDGVISSIASSDEGVVRVSGEGLTATFTGVYPGEATVKVVIGSVEKSFPVKVVGVVVTDFSVPSGLTVTAGESKAYDFVVSPSGAVNGSVVSMKSSDESVLKVSYNGLRGMLSAQKAGEATVTVVIGKVEKSFVVTVVGRKVSDFSVPSGQEVSLGSTASYTLVPTPTDAVDASVVALSSSDESVLKVSHEGLKLVFTPVYAGTATVSVKVGAVEKSFKVTVTGSVVTGIAVPTAIDGATLPYGSTLSGRIMATPLGAYDAGTLTVSALNPSVVSMTHDDSWNCTFRAVGFGTAWFEATAGRGVSAKWSMFVPETVDVQRVAGDDPLPWWRTAEFRVSGDNTGWSYDLLGAGGVSLIGNGYVSVSKAGDRLLVQNTNQSFFDQSCTLVVTTGQQHVQSSVSFTIRGADNTVSFRDSEFDYDSSSGGLYDMMFGLYNQTAGSVKLVKVDGYVFTQDAADYLAERDLPSLEGALMSYLKSFTGSSLPDYRYTYYETLYWDGNGNPVRSAREYTVCKAFTHQFDTSVAPFSVGEMIYKMYGYGLADPMGYLFSGGGGVVLRATVQEGGSEKYYYYSFGF